MAITYVGTGVGFQNKAATSSFTISTGAVLQDDVVTVRIGARYTGTPGAVSTVTDTSGSTWAELISSTGNAASTADLWAAQMLSAGTFTITVTFDATANGAVVAATDRWRGASITADGTGVGSSSAAATNMTASSFTPLVDGDLVIAIVTIQSPTSTISGGQPAGWALLGAPTITPATSGGSGGSNVKAVGGYLIQTTATAVSWTATLNSAANWSSAAAAVIPAATVTPSPRLLTTRAAIVRAANF